MEFKISGLVGDQEEPETPTTVEDMTSLVREALDLHGIYISNLVIEEA